MSNPNIQKLPSAGERTLPVFKEIDELADRVRIRAYNLSARRGFSEGHDLDDWLTAQRDIGWPAAELVEMNDGFVVSVALAGFEAGDIHITVTPRELIIKASCNEQGGQNEERERAQVCWSEFHGSDVYRQIEFPSEVDASKMKAKLEQGMLKVEVPKNSEKKLKRAPKKVSVSKNA